MNAHPDYAEFSDAMLSRHFMPRQAVPEHERWLAGDEALTRRAKARTQLLPDRRYGPGPRQVADLYPAREHGAPLLVFFHGGYWRALSKDHVGHVAGPLSEAGVASVIPNYDLCPQVTLAALVEQAREAIEFALAHASQLNADPSRLFVGGNSAGAHLAAMMLATDWGPRGLGATPIRGVFLLTGIYDLSAIPRIEANDDVRLSPDEALRLSPMFLPMPGQAKALIAVGAREPSLWIEQSRRFAAKLAAEGHWSEFIIVPRLHHFSITRSLGDQQSPLCRALIEFLR